MGMVSRLVSHKGLDLVKAVLDELLETTDIQVVVLGSGDWEYENFFREAAARHPGKLAIRIGFVPSPYFAFDSNRPACHIFIFYIYD